jgi:Caspase domain
MRRRALVVGINVYENFGAGGRLAGAVSDAQRVAELLSVHGNGDPNYSCRVLTSDTDRVTRTRLRKSLRELFMGGAGDEPVLFYFSGHGTVTDLGGYIVTQDAEENDEGIPMDALLNYVNESNVREAVFILDCCKGGAMGSPSLLQSNGAYERSLLRQNTTILAASRHDQNAVEQDGQGLFTSLLIDALEGGAADILGNVTLPAVYAFIEGALGPWEQRPVYKTYTSSVSILRCAPPCIELPALRRLVQLFPRPDAQLRLDPDYEYNEEPVTDKQKTGHLLKRYRDAGLITAATPGQDFFWAAQKGGGVMLTQSGRHFWRLIDTNQI